MHLKDLESLLHSNATLPESVTIVLKAIKSLLPSLENSKLRPLLEKPSELFDAMERVHQCVFNERIIANAEIFKRKPTWPSLDELASGKALPSSNGIMFVSRLVEWVVSIIEGMKLRCKGATCKLMFVSP
jgi:hypothetical protein